MRSDSFLNPKGYSLKASFANNAKVDTVASRNALNGKELAYNSENKRLPIILEGDPGTSKSITLGAIAYKIFKNRKNPVVFIKNEEISFNNEYGREFDLLNNLLNKNEKKP